MTQIMNVDWLTVPFSPISLSALNAKAEMMRRTDNKYVVNRAALRALVPAFTEAFDVLEINERRSFTYATRYFDDTDNRAYLEHHQGVRKRMKVRVRRYLEADLCFLEVKVKGGRNMTEKFRMPYDPFAVDTMTREADEFIQNTYHRQYDKPFYAHLRPSLDMRYRRITLVARAGGERMTIDTDLNFSADGNTCATSPDVFVLETKSENGRGIADLLLRAAGERPMRRCSKYCIGLAATHQVPRFNRFLPTMRKLGINVPRSRLEQWPETLSDLSRSAKTTWVPTDATPKMVKHAIEA
jgi:hypothetical protein